MSKENFIHTPDEYSEYLSEIRQSDNILYTTKKATKRAAKASI